MKKSEDFLQIIERIRIYKGFKTEKQVANLLGLADNALCNHKKRGTLPYKNLFIFCERENLSLDWLLGNNYSQEKIHPSHANPKTPLEEAVLGILRGLSPKHRGDLIGYAEELRLTEVIPRRESKKVSAAQ